MAKNAADRKQKGRPVTAKSPEKAKQETAPTKSPKPAKKRAREPLTREERRKAAWLRKTERKATERTVVEVGAKTSAGLTYAQLEASGLITRQPQPAGPTFEQTLLEVLKEQAQQLESAKPVSLPATPDPEVRLIFGEEVFSPENFSFEAIEESLGIVSLRKVVAASIRSLLGKTEAIFDAYHGFGSVLAAQLAVEDAFEKEPEGSLLQLQLAEIILADDPSETIEDFLEEVYDRIQELQIVASSLDPEGELEKSSRLGLIDKAAATWLQRAAAEEAIRLDLSQRLAVLTASTGAPVEIDETFAALIAEVAQAAEVQRRERAVFRQTLSQRLRQRKEREGRRSSKSSEESGDEELIRFLLAHRGDLAAVRKSLPFHLREQVFQLLEEDERKGPLRREIAAVTTAANRLWAGLKARLVAGANYPETAVAQNAAEMRGLLGVLAQIRALHEQLAEVALA